VNSGVIGQLRAYAELAAVVATLTRQILLLTVDPAQRAAAVDAVDAADSAHAAAQRAVAIAQEDSAALGVRPAAAPAANPGKG
jgi:hypothetical protein